MKKRWIALLLAVMMTAAALVGCGKSDAGVGNEDAIESSEKSNIESGVENNEPVPLTLMYETVGNHPEQNMILEELEKRLNLDITPIGVDPKDNGFETRINLMVASGEVADILIVGNKATLGKYVQNGLVIGLNELLEEHGKETMENKKDILEGLGCIDGTIYGIPRGYSMPSLTVMRKDWLDKLGMEVPTTLEEYYEVLKAFRDKDPDGNGQNDTLPMGMILSDTRTYENIFYAYGLAGNNRFMYKDGKMTHTFLEEGYLEAAAYLNKLYHEKLIEPDFITIANMAEFEKLWNGQMGAFNFDIAGCTQNWLSRYVEDPAPEFVYTALAGPDGKAGTVANRKDIGPWACISSKCKNPEAAMKLLDYICSEEGNTLTFMGIEGRHFEMQGDIAEWIPPYNDAATARQEGVDAYTYINYRLKGWDYKRYNELTQQGIEMAESIGINYVENREDAELASELNQVLFDIQQEALAELVTSTGDLKQIWESYKEKWEEAGGMELLAQTEAIYKRENNMQ